MVVEAAAEKHQLPEAPISITVKAIFKGFEILVTRRLDEQSIIPQVPGIVALVDKLIELGFEPARGTFQPALPRPEIKGVGKESSAPICAVHNIPMVWREGENKQNGKHYAFWVCAEKKSGWIVL